ncbi:MAG: hypothetical protein EZS28_022926 [Streblomastix strix]|uniref:Uncharacterized protein n=1 Tax=Streblomastix strix TaxID=222440 RepID=A0A5J4VGN4_9EUKA|nr:MAG: hypothetical protein EZS28_022926 [Streblomastix strix]
MLQMQQLLNDLINIDWFDIAQKFLITVHGLTHLIRVIGSCARGMYSSIIGSFWNGSFRPRWAYDVQERNDQDDIIHKYIRHHGQYKHHHQNPNIADEQKHKENNNPESLLEEDQWLIALINNITPFFNSFFFCPDANVRCESGLEEYEQTDCLCDECQFKRTISNDDEINEQASKGIIEKIKNLKPTNQMSPHQLSTLRNKLISKGMFISQSQPPLWTFLRWHHLLSIVFPYCTFCPSASVLPRNVPTHIIFAARIGHRRMMHQKRTTGHFTNILPVQPVALKKLQKQRLLQLNAQEKAHITKHELRKAQMKYNASQKKQNILIQQQKDQNIQEQSEHLFTSARSQNIFAQNKKSKTSSNEITQETINHLQEQYKQAQQQWEELIVEQVPSERDCVRSYAELVSELQRASIECMCAIFESIQSLATCTLLSANAYSVFMKKILAFTPLKEYISPQAQLLLSSQPSLQNHGSVTSN